jgi:hypothetical protein
MGAPQPPSGDLAATACTMRLRAISERAVPATPAAALGFKEGGGVGPSDKSLDTVVLPHTEPSA